MTHETQEILKLIESTSSLLRNLPEHKCSLSIENNENRNYYESVEEYISRVSSEDFYEFSSPEAKAKCIETDELWTMQWYPDTPTVSKAIAAPTLLDVLLFEASLDSSD